MKTRLAIAWLAILCLCAWPSINMTGNSTPPSGYTWSLGDLAADATTRLDTDWNHSEWADALDTEAELNALGWTTVDLNEATSGITCTHGGSGNSEDEAGFIAAMTANCTAPSGSTPGECNNVFKIAADCTIDITTVETDNGNGDSIAGTINTNYSNMAIIGAHPTTSFMSVNNTTASQTMNFGAVFHNGNGWGYSAGGTIATYTWTAGDTKGETDLTVTGPCTGLAAGDMVRIVGGDEDGNALDYRTFVEANTSCVITVLDPLPTAFTTMTSIIEMGHVGPRKQIFSNFKVGYQYLPDGTASNSASTVSMFFNMGGSQELLLDTMTVGDFVNTMISTFSSWRVVVRHSTIGRGLYSLRRQNNHSVMNRFFYSSLVSIYDNTYKTGAIRMIYPNDNPYTFGYFGFNYQVPQVPTDPLESGDYCNGISGAQGFPVTGAGGPERGIFFDHDASALGSTPLGRLLIENNSFGCAVTNEGASQGLNRYVTFFRNRILQSNTGQSSFASNNNARTQKHMNFLANRFYTFNSGGGTNMPGTLGLYNVAQTSIANAPAGTGTSWITSGVGKNYVDASVHDDYPADIPPSLAFQQDTAPSWWCQESGDWDGTWSFGYGDGGDNGGTPRKLPAQIRYEGTTCTPP